MDTETEANPMIGLTTQQRSRLLRLAYRFCWNTSDAEDALHNGLLKATENADQLRDPDKHWSWLCRIVIQHCHLLGRDKKRQAVELPTTIQAQGAGGGEQLSREELGEAMRRFLVHLPEQQRVAVTLRHLEQMDYGRIAEIMHLAESTVRAHVRAGRETLRRMILARHPEWTP